MSLMPSLVAFFLVGGCAVHSPLNVQSKAVVAESEGAGAQPHSNPVLVLSSTLPHGVKFRSLGVVEAAHPNYSSTDPLLLLMANKARELGADAVVEVKTWYQPSGFSWSAPHGKGRLVVIEDKSAVDLTLLGGTWL